MRAYDLSFLCDGRRLVGGAVVPDEPRGSVLLLHGIPSTAPPEPGDAGYPGMAEAFAARGWGAAWVDMRSVRCSGGFFSIEGWVRDARAALDAARALDDLAGLPSAVVGSSAGGAVAATMTARGAPVDALALLAAPATWVSFAGDATEAIRRIREEAGMELLTEVLEDPRQWLSEFEEVSTEKVMPLVRVPVLVVHGTADDVVPVHHASLIAERARAAELRVIEGAGHQLRQVPEAIELVLDWLERTLR